jgi:pyridoxamine 5'-phosphate oxidase
MRRDYRRGHLGPEDLEPTWLEQMEAWLEDAKAAVGEGLVEPNAMVFATADASGRSSARSVLLKHLDERGFVLYTNLGSRKGHEVRQIPAGSLVFPWYVLERQVVVVGSVMEVEAEEADAYFRSRPHGSRVGALVSPQSQVIADRSVLDAAKLEIEARYPPGTEVPRPKSWGGLRVVPETVEFWQGGANRLHDRLRYRRDGDDWVVERLAP